MEIVKQKDSWFERPHSALKQVCKTVTDIEAVKPIVAEMFQLMRAEGGIGLAANQVDLDLRLFIMDFTGDEEYVFINPILKVVDDSNDPTWKPMPMDEGCLSFPGRSVRLIRPARVDLLYTALDGKQYSARLTGLRSICAQHEMDHLNGLTIIDRQ